MVFCSKFHYLNLNLKIRHFRFVQIIFLPFQIYWRTFSWKSLTLISIIDRFEIVYRYLLFSKYFPLVNKFHFEPLMIKYFKMYNYTAMQLSFYYLVNGYPFPMIYTCYTRFDIQETKHVNYWGYHLYIVFFFFSKECYVLFT